MTATAALPPDAFKETEIGPIPLDWEVVLLGNLINKGHIAVQNGFPHGGHNQQGRGIPHLRPFNINNDGQIDLGAIKYIEPNGDLQRYLLRIGDVLFNNTNSEELVGKTTYWDKPGEFVLSNHMTILRVLEPHTVDAYFLARYFYNRWLDGYFQSICRRHVNQASISLARIEQIPIPLPPLHEQRRIAHILNTIQREIAAQDKLIAAAREVKRSLMQRLFTYGPGAELAPTKETEIGEVPEHWEFSTIGELCDKGGGTVQTGPFGSQLHASDYVLSGIPSVMPQDIVDNRIVETNIARVSEKDHQRLSRYHLRTGDIVYARRGDIGRRALVGKEQNGWLCGTGSLFIRVGDSDIEPLFLHYYLERPEVNAYILAQAVGTTMLNLNTQILKSVPVVYPSIEEQRLIAQMLDVADRKIAAEEQRKSALQALFKSMLHQLMTGQVRVKEARE